MVVLPSKDHIDKAEKKAKMVCTHEIIKFSNFSGIFATHGVTSKLWL